MSQEFPKVFIYERPDSLTTAITFVIESEGKRFAAKPVELVFEEIVPAMMVSPTLELSHWTANEMLQALSDALAEKDIQPHKESRVRGELDATKYHLEDMRKLLKITK